MNNVSIMGRLTSDPELKQTLGGVACCRFTVAVDRGFKNKQGERETDFISCIAWKQTAQFISQYFSKGKMIAVDGNLRTGSYKDKNHSDVTHYTTDVNVTQAYFCGDKAERSSPSYPPDEKPEYSNHNALEAGQNYGNLSDFEEILSDGDVPF